MYLKSTRKLIVLLAKTPKRHIQNASLLSVTEKLKKTKFSLIAASKVRLRIAVQRMQ